jgi:hypothetical protein
LAKLIPSGYDANAITKPSVSRKALWGLGVTTFGLVDSENNFLLKNLE